jgi:GTP-binding protein Era
MTAVTPDFRSGFVSIVGRPNVGKSTLVNRLVGEKVSIVSTKPQTTRTQVRGVRTTPGSQLVLLDTPGIHKPRTLLGERCNERSVQTLREVDVVCLMIEADAAIGPGDTFIAGLTAQAGVPRLLVVNKTDRAGPSQIAQRLASASELLGEFASYFPVSARTGDGTHALLTELERSLPPGPAYYPSGVVSDQPEAVLVAELLRERLLAVARDELPHSITVTAEEMEDEEDERAAPDAPDAAEGLAPLLRFRAVVHVERESQKGIVIGKGGRVIRDAGTSARKELETLLGARVYLETHVKVDPDWQRRAHSLDRLGL